MFYRHSVFLVSNNKGGRGLLMNDFLMWAGGIIFTGVFGLIGFAWRQHNKDIETLTNHIDRQFQKAEDRSSKQSDDIDKLEKRFEAHRLHASENYAKKTDVEKGFDRVMSALDKIDFKLDGKIDKVKT